ncbi:MAG: phosphopantetheine-binding protein [Methylophilaceae bacterium]
MEKTFDIVKEMIAKKLEIDAASIKPESTLTDVGLDSLDTFDIIFDAEDKFSIKVPNDQVNVSTIQDVVDLFDKLLAEKSAASK